MIAVCTVLAELDPQHSVTRVIFCCFGAESREHHEAALAAAVKSRG
jgi:hypothetical protein